MPSVYLSVKLPVHILISPQEMYIYIVIFAKIWVLSYSIPSFYRPICDSLWFTFSQSVFANKRWHWLWFSSRAFIQTIIIGVKQLQTVFICTKQPTKVTYRTSIHSFFAKYLSRLFSFFYCESASERIIHALTPCSSISMRNRAFKGKLAFPYCFWLT